ncbi:Lrp/AsnC ligand binding domain-containing protein [Pelomonas aquatica]|uniref:Lrp/AsnC family transcriptional regulator n=1 Tax=Pelomonas aquatica TaxID=431058 RepID=A0A9X4LN98_9BURK|nr:Lrp/AsnC ligand binding domain-containing protein [Pelomonas aquatica]MDG0863393.1 Lrp/AsnC family transcriptional regulator [Pelomonas aquatica]
MPAVRAVPVLLGQAVDLQAVVRVRTAHEHIARYVQLFQSLPEVLQVLRVTGEDCFVVYCAFAVPHDLERVADTLAKFGSVTTALVLSNPVAKPLSVMRD